MLSLHPPEHWLTQGQDSIPEDSFVQRRVGVKIPMQEVTIFLAFEKHQTLQDTTNPAFLIMRRTNR